MPSCGVPKGRGAHACLARLSGHFLFLRLLRRHSGFGPRVARHLGSPPLDPASTRRRLRTGLGAERSRHRSLKPGAGRPLEGRRFPGAEQVFPAVCPSADRSRARGRGVVSRGGGERLRERVWSGLGCVRARGSHLGRGPDARDLPVRSPPGPRPSRRPEPRGSPGLRSSTSCRGRAPLGKVRDEADANGS